MNKIIYKSQALQASIIIVAVCLILSLFPMRLWKETVTFTVPGSSGEVTGPVDDSRMIMQSMIAQYNHMGSIGIYLGEGTAGESFYVRMLDTDLREMFEERVYLEELDIPGSFEILVDQDMKVGQRYYLIIQGGVSELGVVSNLYVGSEAVIVPDYPFAGEMHYNDSTMEGRNIVAAYNYTVPLRKAKVAFFDALILLSAVALLYLVRYYYRKKPERNKLMTVERAVKSVGNPLTVAIVLAGLVAVIMEVFGSYTLDNTFFFISILLLGGIMLYGINHNRDGQKAIISRSIIKEKWTDVLQSVFLAMAIAACCEYMNGLYDIHHAIAERKEIIFFALAMIMMLRSKEVLRFHNVVYLIVAGLYGYHYYTETLTEEMAALDLQSLNLLVWAGALAGFVILNTAVRVVTAFIHKEIKKPAYLYGGLMAVFLIMIILFRNGRWWTVALAASFTLFYLQYGAWKKWDILTNIIRAMVLHFIWYTGYSLLHRPFVTYRTVRYTHIFHTVTITATYLTMVECAALVLFLMKLRKSHKLKDIWKETVFFGVVTSYVLFTMARTGFLAVAVTALLAVIIMAAGNGREKLKNILTAAVVMAVATIVCFPVTFFVQRTVPALVSEPRLHEIESYPDEVMRGRKVSSLEFMRVGRFIEVFGEKVFSIPETTFDIYGEIKEFNETHTYVDGQLMTTQQAEALGLYSAVSFAEEKATEADKELGADSDSTAGSMDASPDESEVGRFDGEDQSLADYTNGRSDIFRAYLNQLNMPGHQEMGALLDDGTLAVHAHNIYLQFAYDHGIAMGILFIAVMVATLLQSHRYYQQNKDRENYAALPAVVTVAVAAEGLVEWVFHFSNPSGFILMLIIAPLIFGLQKRSS